MKLFEPFQRQLQKKLLSGIKPKTFLSMNVNLDFFFLLFVRLDLKKKKQRAILSIAEFVFIHFKNILN